MRIATYNLYEGAKDTLPWLQHFTEDKSIDVLCVQEANGWVDGVPSPLQRMKIYTGLEETVYGDSNTRFKLATLSRIPILRSQVHTDGFWHCAVQTTIPHGDTTLDIWNVHLNPSDEDSRLNEAERLTAMVDADKPALVVGDFNSLAESDEYPDQLLTELLLKGIRKFGSDRLRYDVTNHFIQAGLIDVAAARGKHQQTTVPTLANKDPHHAARMRLDYMFATTSLARSIVSIDVPIIPSTNVISDHYPIVLTVAD